jgi:hypothetical protein
MVVGGIMQSGNVDPGRSARETGGKTPEADAGQTRKTVASGDRQLATRKESTRPWAVRRPDGPSWVEKVEQF